jgi:hypothetical protein
VEKVYEKTNIKKRRRNVMGKKLIITKAQAIKNCKKIWKLVLEGKANTRDEAIDLLLDGNIHACPLCAYDMQFNRNCSHCPLITQLHLIKGCCNEEVNYHCHPVEFAKQVMKLK